MSSRRAVLAMVALLLLSPLMAGGDGGGPMDTTAGGGAILAAPAEAGDPEEMLESGEVHRGDGGEGGRAGVTDVYWNGTMVLTSDHTVDFDERLIISPGVLIFAEPGVSLKVNGRISAVGTPTQPIRFSSPDEGSKWGGLVLSSYSGDGGRRLERVQMLDADAALTVRTSPLVLRDCMFTDCTTGFDFQNVAGVLVDISGATITGAQTGVMSTSSSPRLDSVIFSGCDVGVKAVGGAPTIANSSFSASAFADARVQGGAALSLENCSFSMDRIEIADELSSVAVDWHLKVRVLDGDGDAAAGVSVKVANRTREHVASGLSRADGRAGPFVCREAVLWANATERHTSHRVSLSRWGLEDTFYIYMLRTRAVPLTLEASSKPRDMTVQVSSWSQDAFIRDLCDFGTRHTSTPQKFAAAMYLYDYFVGVSERSAHPMTVEFFNSTHHDVEYDDNTTQDVLEIIDLVVTFPGTDTTSTAEYVVGAHYDSHNVSVPGADDDASGVAGVMELARILSRYRFEETVRLLLFDAEEEGYLGSWVYAENASARGDDIRYFLQLDMIGYNRDEEGYPCRIICNDDSVHIGEYLGEINEDMGLGLDYIYYNANSKRNSDHGQFWDQGFVAVEVIESEHVYAWNPYYHTEDDTADTINLTFQGKMTGLVLGAVAKNATSVNLAPTRPTELEPGSTHRLTPNITWAPSADMNGDVISYYYSLYEGPEAVLSARIASGMTREAYYPSLELKHGSRYLFHIYADDGQGEVSPTAALVMYVNNTPPEIGAVPDIYTGLDAATSFNVSAWDADVPADPLIFGFSAQSAEYEDVDPEPGEVPQGWEGAWRKVRVTWTPGPDEVGLSSLTVVVHDNQGGTARLEVNVSVTDINHPPEALKPFEGVTMKEDTVYFVVLNTSGHFNDPDPREPPLNISAVGNANITADMWADGTLWLTPAPDWYGFTMVRIVAADRENLTANTTINVTVEPVNDPPAIVDPGPQEVPEGLNFTLNLTVLDPDNDPGDMRFTTDHWVSLDRKTGQLRLLPDDQHIGTHEVNVTVSDGDLSSFLVIVLNVTNVNDPPELMLPGCDWGGLVLQVGEPFNCGFSAYDPDPDEILLFELYFEGEQHLLHLTGYDGDFTFTAVMEHIGTHTIVMKVTDAAGESAENRLPVTVEKPAEPKDGPDDDGGGSAAVYAAIAGVIAALALVALLFVLKKRRARWQKPAEDDGAGSDDEEGAEEQEGGKPRGAAGDVAGEVGAEKALEGGPLPGESVPKPMPAPATVDAVKGKPSTPLLPSRGAREESEAESLAKGVEKKGEADGDANKREGGSEGVDSAMVGGGVVERERKHFAANGQRRGFREQRKGKGISAITGAETKGAGGGERGGVLPKKPPEPSKKTVVVRRRKIKVKEK